MKEAWKFLDWEYVCEQSPKIQTAYKKADWRAEYGINFYEFIYTAEGKLERLEHFVQEWWDSLDIERKRELLSERRQFYRDKVDSLDFLLNI